MESKTILSLHIRGCSYLKTFIIIGIITCVSCTKQVEQECVIEQPINEVVYASGKILPKDYQFIASSTYDNISSILVKEEDYVSNNQILVCLGNQQNSKQIEMINEEICLVKKIATNNSPLLNMIKSKIDYALEKYNTDKKNAERYTTLQREQSVSSKEIEEYKLKAKQSKTEYENLSKQYEIEKDKLKKEYLELERLKSELEISHSNKVLKSKINGKVYSIDKNVGDIAIPEEPIMLIGKDNEFILELFIDERDISRIKIGQKVYFQTDIYKDQVFEAYVSKIYPVFSEETRSFKVDAEIETSTLYYPCSPVEANIVIRENQKTLLVPEDYLIKEKYLLIQRSANVEEIEVSTGIKVGDYIEIFSKQISPQNIILKKQ